MGERRNAASLFTHSLKTPLASIKTAAELLLKHLQGQISEKDLQLLQVVQRNAVTLEARINRLLELSHTGEDSIDLHLNCQELQALHDASVQSQEPSGKQPVKTSGDLTGKIVVHADPEIADLIPKFLENRAKDIQVIKQALEKNDFETIRILGHSMKGAGGGYGFPTVTDIGKCLEDAARIGDAETIVRGLKDLSTYLNSVEVIYDES